VENTQNNNTQNKEEEPMSLQDEVLKAGKDTLIKRTKDKVNEKLDSGMDAKEILQGLLNSASSLAESPVATGDRMGLGTSLIKGHGTERPNYTEPLGMANAISLMKMQQDQKGEALDVEEQKLNIQKLKALIQSQTPQAQQQAELNKAKGQALAQEEKNRALTERNVKIANNKLSLTLKKFDEMADETERLSGLKPGRLGGLATKFFGATGQNAKVAPFRGQIVETAIAIARIAAPGARVGPRFINVMEKTLPTDFSNMEEARGQILTSMTNAFANEAATNPDINFDIKTFEAQANIMLDKIVNRQREKIETRKTDKTVVAEGRYKGKSVSDLKARLAQLEKQR